MGPAAVVAEHLHAKSFGHLRHTHANPACTDDAHRLTGNLIQWGFAVGEVRSMLPISLPHRLSVFIDAVGDRKQHRKDVLGHRIGRIVRHVADQNSLFFCRFNVNGIVTGRCDTDQFHVWTGIHRLPADRALVDQHHLGVANSVDDARLLGAVIDNRRSQLLDAFPAQIARIERKAIQHQNLHKQFLPQNTMRFCSIINS